MEDYEIFRVLSISTTHVPESALEILEQRYIGYSYAFGTWIWVNALTDIVIPGDQEAEEALRTIGKLALDLNCDYINLDRDSPIYDSLKEFDWDIS